MNVVFLVSHFPELSEQFIINQIIGLIDEGVDVSIISLHDPSEIPSNCDIDKYRLLEKTKSIAIPETGVIRIIKVIPKIVKLIFISPIKLFQSLNIFRYKRIATSLKLVYLLNSLKNERYSLLHCHFGPNGVVGAFLKSIGITDKLITTFHGSDINTYPLRHGKDIYKFLFQEVDKITVNTSFTGEKVISYGADREKIIIIPVGLKYKDYPFLKHGFDFTGTPSILTVARLTEKKGHVYSINAIAEVIKTFPKTLYHIVGSGPLKTELVQLVSDLKIEENIIFHGSCNRTEIFELYKQSTMFILSSVTASDGDMEGQGLVLQEAGAAGLPVISTLHNGIPDGVVNEKTGFLVSEKDYKALADKIVFLISNPLFAKKMGAKGRKFVHSKYDIPILSKKIIKVYEDVIKL